MVTVLFETSLLSIINRDDYIYTHTKNSVIYLLPYRRPIRGEYLLGRFEVCPAHGAQKSVYAVTGQCEPDANPLDVAKLELYEECGIIANTSQFVSLGSGFLSKQADTLAYFFMVDVTEMARQFAPTDSSKFEQGSYCDWIDRERALSALCVGLQALVARAGL